jgi:HD-like signal output (HDOD) protein
MIGLAPNRDLLLQIAQQLPANPQILLQLSDLLTDVNSGLDDVALFLRRDTSLAARVIRISNSVAFGMAGRVASIEEAVNRVGYAEIYRLVGLATAAQLADHNLLYYGISGVQLRDNTLVTALLAEGLAVRAGLDGRRCYTSALLRSSGKMVLDRLARRSPQADYFARSGSPFLLPWERATFGCTNTEVADTVLTAWRFPSAIVHPIRDHYTPEEKGGEHAIASALLYVACGLARDAGHGLPGEFRTWDVTPALLATIGISPSLAQEAVEEAITAFDGIKATL